MRSGTMGRNVETAWEKQATCEKLEDERNQKTRENVGRIIKEPPEIKYPSKIIKPLAGFRC